MKLRDAEDLVRPVPPERGASRLPKSRCPRGHGDDSRSRPRPQSGTRTEASSVDRPAGARAGARAGSPAGRSRRCSSISRTKSRVALSALCLLSRQLLPGRSPFVDTVVRKSANVHLSGGPPGTPTSCDSSQNINTGRTSQTETPSVSPARAESEALLKIKPRITPPVSSGRLPGALMTFPVIVPAYLSINHIYLLRPALLIAGKEGGGLGPADRFSINNNLFAQNALESPWNLTNLKAPSL